jgi:hypothetical protein
MTPRLRVRGVIASSVAIAFVSSSVPLVARGDDKASAQVLFDQAQALGAQGKWGDACPKFEESQQLDPTINTLYYIADCWEHAGKLATAWAGFVSTADQAKTAGETAKEKKARERAAALQGKTSKLTVNVATPDLDGLVVKRGTIVVGKALFGVAAPIDGGAYEITAEAPGKKAWRAGVTIAESGANEIVTVPALEDASSGAGATSDATSTTSTSKSGPSTAAFVVGGLGVVAIGVGAVFGLQAISKRKDSDGECPGGHCTQAGVDLNDQAKRDAWISNIAIGVGVVSVGVGVYLLLHKSSEEKSAVRVDPLVGARGGGLNVSCSF